MEKPVSPTNTDSASPFSAVLPASASYLKLGSSSAKELEGVFLRGTTPDLDSLVGWEFRGMNQPFWAKLAGIKKFIKGFEKRGDEVFGYNTPVVQNRAAAPWIAKPRGRASKRFGYYRVDPVSASAIDNAYLHAVLLDYGKGGNGRFDPSAGLRDYLIQVEQDNPDLYLGKAYYAVGRRRISTNFFILERLRLADDN